MVRLGSRMDDYSQSFLGFRLPEKVTGFAATMMKKKIAKSGDTCFIEGRQHVLLMMVNISAYVLLYAHKCLKSLFFGTCLIFFAPPGFAIRHQEYCVPRNGMDHRPQASERFNGRWRPNIFLPASTFSVHRLRLASPTKVHHPLPMPWVGNFWNWDEEDVDENISKQIRYSWIFTLLCLIMHICACIWFCLFTGQAKGWKFPKFHVTNHVPREILCFGCLEVRAGVFSAYVEVVMY